MIKQLKNKLKKYIKNRGILSKKVNPNILLDEKLSLKYESNIIYSNQTNIKPICFYLPQFHTFHENDTWWGKGFTEWSNTKKSRPKYIGHYQPREPHNDFGYYILDNPEILKRQVTLAKQHGIYGFCFYYYWFSGKRLMEKPLDIFLENKDIDIPFCLCWANENWTRTWDGAENNILIKQDYSEKDKLNFISDMAKYLKDSRYIKINNKPIIIVYNPQEIKDVKEVFASWRKTAYQEEIGDILIYTCQIRGKSAYRIGIEDDVDGEIEFPPHTPRNSSIEINKYAFYDNSKPSYIFNYNEIIDGYLSKTFQHKLPVYKTATLRWDNSARKNINWMNYINFSPELFYKWISGIIQYTKNNTLLHDKFFFINAWNEWAEGTYLEPDRITGYTNINTLSKALYELSYYKMPIDLKQKNEQSITTKSNILIYVKCNDIEKLHSCLTLLNSLAYKYELIIESKNISQQPNNIPNNCVKYDLYNNNNFIINIKNYFTQNYYDVLFLNLDNIMIKQINKTLFNDFLKSNSIINNINSNITILTLKQNNDNNIIKLSDTQLNLTNEIINNIFKQEICNINEIVYIENSCLWLNTNILKILIENNYIHNITDDTVFGIIMYLLNEISGYTFEYSLLK